MVKDLILELFFPKFCINCGREGNYFCEDCQATLEISEFHQKYSTKNLTDLYFAVPYQNPLIKNLIQKFKYEPLVKELAKPLASLIITHFRLLENPPDFSKTILIPVPLHKKRVKWRGFNQAEELAFELSKSLGITLYSNCLFKIKETLPQVELSEEERQENIKGVFLVKNGNLIKGKRIFLVDDVYTTGSTMEECARVLKTAGAAEILGVTIAKG